MGGLRRRLPAVSPMEFWALSARRRWSFLVCRRGTRISFGARGHGYIAHDGLTPSQVRLRTGVVSKTIARGVPIQFWAAQEARAHGRGWKAGGLWCAGTRLQRARRADALSSALADRGGLADDCPRCPRWVFGRSARRRWSFIVCRRRTRIGFGARGHGSSAHDGLTPSQVRLTTWVVSQTIARGVPDGFLGARRGDAGALSSVGGEQESALVRGDTATSRTTG